MNKQVRIEDLKVYYGIHAALWDIRTQIPCGNSVAILGPNGAGKSTLMQTMLGMVVPLTGRVVYEGNPRIAYVPQRSHVDWDFPITVFEVALMGLYKEIGMFGFVRSAHRQKTMKVLERLGLAAFVHRQISELSGGQQQRLFIARAILQDAEYYFFDEPFSGIDLTTEKLVVEIFQELQREEKTLFVVHHDLNTAPSYFNWCILLNRYLVAAGPMQEVFTLENLEKTYGNHHQVFDEAIRRSKECFQGL